MNISPTIPHAKGHPKNKLYVADVASIDNRGPTFVIFNAASRNFVFPNRNDAPRPREASTPFLPLLGSGWRRSVEKRAVCIPQTVVGPRNGALVSVLIMITRDACTLAREWTRMAMGTRSSADVIVNINPTQEARKKNIITDTYELLVYTYIEGR